MARAILSPPSSPDKCSFARVSANYTADLRTRVEPCIFGGDPDCSQCGCSISAGLHWIEGLKVAGPLRVGHLARGSMHVGAVVNRLIPGHEQIARWSGSEKS